MEKSNIHSLPVVRATGLNSARPEDRRRHTPHPGMRRHRVFLRAVAVLVHGALLIEAAPPANTVVSAGCVYASSAKSPGSTTTCRVEGGETLVVCATSLDGMTSLSVAIGGSACTATLSAWDTMAFNSATCPDAWHYTCMTPCFTQPQWGAELPISAVGVCSGALSGTLGCTQGGDTVPFASPTVSVQVRNNYYAWEYPGVSAAEPDLVNFLCVHPPSIVSIECVEPTEPAGRASLCQLLPGAHTDQSGVTRDVLMSPPETVIRFTGNYFGAYMGNPLQVERQGLLWKNAADGTDCKASTIVKWSMTTLDIPMCMHVGGALDVDLTIGDASSGYIFKSGDAPLLPYIGVWLGTKVPLRLRLSTALNSENGTYDAHVEWDAPENDGGVGFVLTYALKAAGELAFGAEQLATRCNVLWTISCTPGVERTFQLNGLLPGTVFRAAVGMAYDSDQVWPNKFDPTSWLPDSMSAAQFVKAASVPSTPTITSSLFIGLSRGAPGTVDVLALFELQGFNGGDPAIGRLECVDALSFVRGRLAPRATNVLSPTKECCLARKLERARSLISASSLPSPLPHPPPPLTPACTRGQILYCAVQSVATHREYRVQAWRCEHAERSAHRVSYQHSDGNRTDSYGDA